MYSRVKTAIDSRGGSREISPTGTGYKRTATAQSSGQIPDKNYQSRFLLSGAKGTFKTSPSSTLPATQVPTTNTLGGGAGGNKSIKGRKSLPKTQKSSKTVENLGMMHMSRRTTNKSILPATKTPKTNKSKVTSGQDSNANAPHTELTFTSVAKPAAQNRRSSRDRNGNSRVASILADLSSDPMKWFRDEQETDEISRSLSRNPVKHHIGPYKAQGILDPPPDEKMVTIGGYIISMERGHDMKVSVRPKLSSHNDGVEIEVRIQDVDPSAIRLDRRYNAIIVIGVKESALNRKDLETLKANLQELDPSYQMEDELIEVVNIFIPRDITLAKISVTQPDSKGRILIKGP